MKIFLGFLKFDDISLPMSNTNRRPMPAESEGTASLIHSTTGFLTGPSAERSGNYQPHANGTIRQGVYVLHIPSGKAGRVNGVALEEYEGELRRKFRKVYGISWDCEYPAEVLRRITPKQYKALPEECKITSPETGIF